VRHALATRLWIEAKFPQGLSATELREHYGAVVDFDRDALLAIGRAAEGKNPAEELRAFEQLCTLLPEDCDQWARRLRDAGKEDQAAQVYERWAEVGDAVTVSNRIGWTVEYLRTHGQKARAERLAEQAASTGSGGGLKTYATFLENIGRTEAAYEAFTDSWERYENPADLLAFIGRHQDVPRYQAVKQEIVKSTFPDGFRRVVLTDLASERATGAEVTRVSPDPEFSGLQVGDIIGATDGIRVTTLTEFRVARSVSDAKDAPILVWRGGKWIELRVPRAAFAETTYRN
jgi:hypothetical protein